MLNSGCGENAAKLRGAAGPERGQMPTTRTFSNYLEEAHQIILDPTESYTKEREAQVRSLTRLAEVASGEALAKRNKPITYGFRGQGPRVPRLLSF
jgi:hypothetical protein